MNYNQFSENKDVNNFVSWISSKLDGENSFIYSYATQRPRNQYKFNSMYSAYEQYSWRNRSFSQNQIELSNYSNMIKKGLGLLYKNTHDSNLVRENCKNILSWGGVLGNETRGNLKKLNDIKNLNEYLLNAIHYLNLEICKDESESYKKLHCNAGFSKIYSSIIDDFIIYDSRVSSALCLFIRLFSKDSALKNIPEILRFSYLRGRNLNQNENRRNPSSQIYIFNELYANDHRRYLKNNIRASWLIKLILDKTESRFNLLDRSIQARALESALFMIGYEINI